MNRLQKAIEEQGEVSTLKSGALSLKYSGGRIAIADAAGRLSKLGKAFYQRTGKEKPNSGFDQNTSMVRDGNKEYIV